MMCSCKPCFQKDGKGVKSSDKQPHEKQVKKAKALKKRSKNDRQKGKDQKEAQVS